MKTEERKLRIVHTESSCGWGGQEIRILTEAKGMQGRGHYVHLLCVQDSAIYKEAIKRNIPVTALPIAKKTLNGIFSIRQWLKKNTVDIVNTHSSTDSWLVALARLGINIPIVRTRHVSSPIPQNIATRWLYTKGSDFIITTGERLRLDVINSTGVTSDRIKSIPTGVDEYKFIPGDKVAARQLLQLPNNAVIIGIVATIRTWKGHVYLIEALAKLQYENVYLLIVGDGPNRENVKDVVNQYNLADRVIFAGQQDDVVPWLQAMDIFVLPSYGNEGVPQTLIQAMLCELIVVSTPVGSIAELVRHGVTGFLTPPKDSDELSCLLNRLLLNTIEKKQIATQGREFVLSNHGFRSMLNDMEYVFKKMVAI